MVYELAVAVKKSPVELQSNSVELREFRIVDTGLNASISDPFRYQSSSPPEVLPRFGKDIPTVYVCPWHRCEGGSVR